MQETKNLREQLYKRRSRKNGALDLNTVSPQFLPANYDESDRSDRHFGLRTAPTFRPNDKEWSDPLQYIEKIRAVGERSGIVKIIPPEGWAPDFALSEKKLNSMDGGTRSVLNYLDQLEQFHHQQGSEFVRAPMKEGETLDLLKLKKEVSNRGGYEVVERENLWADVAGGLSWNKGKSQFDAATCFEIYQKYIRPFEVYLASTRVSSKYTGGRMGATKSAEEPENGLDGKLKQEAESPNDLGIFPKRKPPKRKNSVDADEELEVSDSCAICGGVDNADRILLCDSCDREFHLYCLTPPLASVPEADEWFCPDCLKSYGNDFGFEDGRDFSLPEFQIFANEFKTKWFELKNFPTENGRLSLSEDDVEREFWRLVESPYEDLEVEYGADLHTSSFGSGFPVMEKFPNNAASLCAWNLNNVSILPESLLCNIRKDISGIMIPWLYIGMVFSTFCWHTEDHYTYSINFNHWGETKTWYGVPASHASKFEETMRKSAPELFEASPDLLFHLTTMLSPRILKDNGVEVFAVDQRAGEFIVTFPQAYHSGFNHGFNCAEAVNFALPNWLPYGLRCVRRYEHFKKQPIFSHDEIVLNTVARDTSMKTAFWLKPQVEVLQRRETSARAAFKLKYPDVEETLCLDAFEDDDKVCAVCRCFCYLSFISCACDANRVLCLKDAVGARNLCDCSNRRLNLFLRLSNDELNDIRVDVLSRIRASEEWLSQYRTLMLQHSEPLIKDMQALVVAADKIPFPIVEANNLKSFVKKALEWVEEAASVLGLRRKSGATDRRSLEAIERTLNSLQSRPFTCPEIAMLRELRDRGVKARDQAIARLQAPTLEENDIDVFLESFEDFDIDIKEFTMLEYASEDIAWIARAKSYLDGMEPRTYETLADIVADARSIGSVASEGPYPALLELRKTRVYYLSELKKMKASADRWKLDVVAMYKQKAIHIDDLKALKESSVDIPVDNDSLRKVKKHLKVISQWLSKVRSALPRSLLPSVDGDDSSKEVNGNTEGRDDTNTFVPSVRASLSDAKGLIRELGELTDVAFKSDEAVILEKSIKKCEEWVQSGRRLLARTSLQLAEILAELISKVRICMGVDVPKHAIHCICRGPEDGFMIECDSCHVWYHGTCMRVTKRDARAQDTYICIICQGGREAIPNQRRPTPEQLVSFRESSNELPFIPAELTQLDTLIKEITSWRNKGKAYLNLPESWESIEPIKDILRGMEGFLVDLEEDMTPLYIKLKQLLPLEKLKPPEPPVTAKSNDAKSNELYCICRKPYDMNKPMIACDTCEDWFHFDCVNLSAAEAELISSYLCPWCDGKLPPPTVATAGSAPSTSNSNGKAQSKAKKEASAETASTKRKEPANQLDSSEKRKRPKKNNTKAQVQHSQPAQHQPQSRQQASFFVNPYDPSFLPPTTPVPLATSAAAYTQSPTWQQTSSGQWVLVQVPQQQHHQQQSSHQPTQHQPLPHQLPQHQMTQHQQPQTSLHYVSGYHHSQPIQFRQQPVPYFMPSYPGQHQLQQYHQQQPYSQLQIHNHQHQQQQHQQQQQQQLWQHQQQRQPYQQQLYHPVTK